MKIAFPTSGDSLEAPLESRFGRARNILIWDTDSQAFELLDNAQSKSSPQGAGIQTAERVVRAGANCVLAPNYGPKAFRVLRTAGVLMYYADVSTIREALQAWQSGVLEEAKRANVGAHWG